MSQRDNYDIVRDILKTATDDIVASGVPMDEVPPVFADYLILSVLALGKRDGLSDEAATAIIDRMQNTLNDWRSGKLKI